MSGRINPARLLLVTGLSGAGRSTALDTLEDAGWEVVDNMPLPLIDRLLTMAPSDAVMDEHRPLAIGIDTRTRGFDAARMATRAARLRAEAPFEVETLFLDCGTDELARRYDETRRRHPLAPDRPARDGIARETELLQPLRAAADQLIDTTALSRADLQDQIRRRFAPAGGARTVISVMSFGFARGLPRDADLVFDMRYLRNPHWDRVLKPLTGLDRPVADYVAADPAHDVSLAQIESLLLTMVPRHIASGKAYLAIAFGCTGGRHRSVHVAEEMARRLRDQGFCLTVSHRDLATPPQDALEGPPAPA
ncbi:RNase adapter RapZ [Sphingomonas changnyeongensis]|uniref:RNase adapter RapZ n=1 Tax=Sphingomonas changnyeongensis TaxID=2698679 RepID=A0A7Z2NX40_9SPHN|nr:RNase adapter RapZ [Sphingomonas changnyeongensis]QHL91046.1 RNase adapter RapZ [Sphingomonas changnyeongensis]